ncbi:MAG: hypothetical protein K2M07_07800 [Muribaculaceae bacterium]|nr:hypothetical protein [Muribaculaceae bacterium]
MKQSTKYLLFLIGAFFLAAILYPIILHYVPQEKWYNQKWDNNDVVEEIAADYNEREVPIVDMPVAVINLSESLKVSSVIIEGVESPKDQTIEIGMAASDRYLNAISIDADPETSTLKIVDNNNACESIDSLVIRIAVPANGRLDVLTDMCHSVSFSNINAEAIELTSKCTTTADCVDLNINSCNINAFTFIASSKGKYGNKFYLNCMNSMIESLSISTVRDFNLNANGNVRNLAINAEAVLEISITGYDSDIALNKNNHKVFIDR